MRPELRANGPRACGVFCAVIAGSVALHAVFVVMAPNAAGAEAPSMTLATFVEIADPPPPPPVVPPVAREEPAREPMQGPVRGAPASNARTRPTAPASHAATAAAAPPASQVPADFTSTVLSSTDGPGVAVPLPSKPPLSASSGATVGSSATGSNSPHPRFVALADLARPPRAPRLDTALEKNYPAAARQSGIAGRAVLRVEVLADGRIGAVRHVSETYAGFADACERTVKSGAWEPPLDRDGKPVATEITYTCRFDVKA